MNILFNNRLFLHSIKCKTLSNDRHIWGWITTVFNKPDEQRIEAVGIDRAAAEWLLRNGASIKWTASEDWVKDYNSLGIAELSRRRIRAIDATDSAIAPIGFTHLKGLDSLETFIIKNNGYIDDKAIEMLGFCEKSLKYLEISSCIGVTDKGVLSLTQLRNLNYLKLFDLPSVEDRDNCLNALRNALTTCKIDWKIAKPKHF